MTERTPTPPLPAEWDCAIGTPEEDHDWHFVVGDSSVGESDAWVCRACGATDYEREPPIYDDDY